MAGGRSKRAPEQHPKEHDMNKTNVRSYAITSAGDLRVTGYRGGDRVDLSKYYEAESHPPRAEMRQECYLDVFAFDDGALTWTGSPNGHDVPAALTYSWLLGLFLADVEAEEENPRAF
jgi:hypothetical protein